MKTRNRRYPRSSGMNGDKSGESGAFLFSQCVPDSAIVGDHSRHMKTQICTAIVPRANSSTIFKMADRREKTLGKAELTPLLIGPFIPTH